MWKAKPTQEGLAIQVRSDSIAALSASDQLQAVGRLASLPQRWPRAWGLGRARVGVLPGWACSIRRRTGLAAELSRESLAIQSQPV